MHKRTLEQETLYDKAMIEYETKLDCGASKAPTVIEASGPSLPTGPTLMMGWGTESDTVMLHQLHWQANAVP